MKNFIEHPNHIHILQSGVFKDVKSLDDLENNITRIFTGEDSNINKGNVFEIITEAELKSNPLHQAKNVWIKTKLIDQKILNKLKIIKNDTGVDGVLETLSGEFIALQIKYKTSHENISWRNLGTFFSSDNEFDHTMIITNSYDIGGTVKKLKEPLTLKRDYFQDLDHKAYERIVRFINKEKPQIEKFKLLDHQKEAISKCLNGFKTLSRLQMISACGTQKTTTGLRIAEKANVQSVLVIVPSLALLDQTLKEWIEQSYNNFPYLCVGSDKSIGKDYDDIILNQSDLPFTITTNPEEIALWINKNKKNPFYVIFSTYDSVKRISEATDNIHNFDFAIFDEAHKTAGGTKRKKFQFALHDQNIKIKKRLFMTATPKLHGVSKYKNDDELKVVYSMDNEKVYGPKIYKLSFAKAARKDIIVPFKIIITMADSERVSEEKRRLAGTEVDEELLKTTHVAAQLALVKALERTGAKKAISFHTNIKSADSFCSKETEGIESYLHDFKTYHVNGSQKMSDRKDIMNAFRNDKKSLVSNARCLTEGVDVPAVDLVYFSSPKKSEVDIAQAVGRSMRKAGINKKLGFVAVPLFVEKYKSETNEEAVQRTDYETIAEVINALKDHDEELQIILEEARESMGLKKGFNFQNLTEKIEIISDEIDLSILEKSIYTEIVNRLTPSWYEWYGRLKDYLKENKKCPSSKGDPLDNWCGEQRSRWRRGILPQKRVDLLDSLIPEGWVWDQVKLRLITNAKLIVEYCLKYKMIYVPETHKYKGEKIGQSFKSFRQSYAKNIHDIDVEKIIKKIPGILLDGNLDDHIWTLKFESYKRFVKNHNELTPQKGQVILHAYGIEEFDLYTWLIQQQARYLRSKGNAKKSFRPLNDYQIKRFEDEIPFWGWDSWYRSFNAYKYVVNKFGTATIDKKVDLSDLPKDLRNVPRWISKQRSHYIEDNFQKSSKLDLEKLKLLEKEGFNFSPFDLLWYQGFMHLLDYVKKYKTSRVPQNYITDHSFKNGPDFKLGSWVSKERIKKEGRRKDHHHKTKNIVDTWTLLRSAMLNGLPEWYLNWADLREGGYLAANNQDLKSVIFQFNEDKFALNGIYLALYAGLRLSDLHLAKQVTVFNINCLEIPKMRGTAEYRLLPIHKSLSKGDFDLGHNPKYLQQNFNRRKPKNLKSLKSFYSITFRFYEELEKVGLSKNIISFLMHGAPKEEWTENLLIRLKKKIDLIHYDFSF